MRSHPQLGPTFTNSISPATVGPLARAALSELNAVTVPRFTVLTGTVDSGGDLHSLLDALDTLSTPAADLRVTRRDTATDLSTHPPAAVSNQPSR